MFGLFNRSAPSKDVARDRLKMIVVSDRLGGSNKMLEMMKNEVLLVLQKYLHIDEADFDIQICQQNQEGGDDLSPRLKADIPIKSMKRR